MIQVGDMVRVDDPVMSPRYGQVVTIEGEVLGLHIIEGNYNERVHVDKVLDHWMKRD